VFLQSSVVRVGVLAVSLGAVMSNGQQWREVRVGDTLTFSAPAGLEPTSARGMDTDFGEWRGHDLSVRVDAGLFVDPLTRYGSQPNVRALDESIDGQRARIVTFDQSDGSRFTAAHFPDLQDVAGGSRKLTFVVISSGDRSADEAMRIVRSIRFRR
jgi:hypothetical protein